MNAPIAGPNVLSRLRNVWRWVRRHGAKWGGGFLKLATVVGAVVVVSGAALYVGRAIQHQWFWRSGEYDTLTRLKAGFDLRYFEDQLGLPVFIKRRGGWVESTFRGHAYWVQTISHNGAVELYAVTSCSGDFRPTFEISDFPGNPVTLERSTLASVGIESLSYEYLLGANTYHFYETIYGGFEGHYKTYVWGASSTCPNESIFDRFPQANLHARMIGKVASKEPKLKPFREDAIVNTYIETAPFTSLANRGKMRSVGIRPELFLFHGFTIGPATSLVRSVNSGPPSVEP